MFAPTLPLMVLEQDCNSAVTFVTTALESSGYVVLESFDLQSAMAVHDGSDCPPHSCACQMVVLLVYPRKGLPITLVFNSDDLQTAVFLTNNVNNPNHSDGLKNWLIYFQRSLRHIPLLILKDCY